MALTGFELSIGLALLGACRRGPALYAYVFAVVQASNNAKQHLTVVTDVQTPPSFDAVVFSADLVSREI